VWFGVLALLVVALELRRPRRWPAVLNLAIMLGIVLAAATYVHPGEVWSPYYRINVQPVPGFDTSIFVNGIPHQAMHPVSLEGPQPEVFYDRVYARFPGRVFSHALIVGAGSGYGRGLRHRQSRRAHRRGGDRSAYATGSAANSTPTTRIRTRGSPCTSTAAGRSWSGPDRAMT